MFLEFLQVFLPIVIYILLIVFLIIGIIIGIKLIGLMDNVERIVSSVGDKLESLNGIFNVIDFATDKLTLVTDKVVDALTGFISKLIHKKSKKEE